MHDYLLDPELVRLTIAMGVVVSLLFYQRFGVTTGGAIIPGYLALFATRPTHIIMTFAIASATYWVVQKQLRPRFMLWGRRLYETEILVALVFQTVWTGTLWFFTQAAPQVVLLYSIGFLLPGIIAHDMGRQKVYTTILAGTICGFIVFGCVTLIGAIRDSLDLPISFMVNVRSLQPTAYPISLLTVAVFVSVLTSIALYRYSVFFDRLSFSDALRTGGFVTAAYLALFVNRPVELLFVGLCVAVTYLIVTKVLMQWTILFGRTKVAAMVLTGMAVTWIAEFLLHLSGIGYVPWAGFNVISPVIVALLANDTQRQGVRSVVIGTTISTLVVFSVMRLLIFLVIPNHHNY